MVYLNFNERNIMNKITYLKKISYTKYLISLLIFFSGLYFLLYVNILFGLIFTVIGFNFLLTEGTQIDFDQMIYRNIRSVFGIHIGKWKKLPVFDYISVFKTTEKTAISVTSATAVMSDEVYLLNLFYEQNKYITFYKTTNKEDAFEKAKHFRNVLNLNILDATERQSVWFEG